MMRIKTLTILAVAMALLMGSTAFAESWTRFSSSQGRFSVMVPVQPKHQSSTSQTPVGPIVENSYVAENRGASFTVSYTDLPGTALLFEGRDGIYQKAREALLKHTKGQALSFKETKVSGKAGRVLEYTLGNGQAGRALMVIVGRRLYVADASAAAPVAGAAFDKFFRSLSVQGS